MTKPKKRKKKIDDTPDAEKLSEDALQVMADYEEEFHRCEDYKT